jgi:cobalt-zinc-cadmium efflux system membrane fusion protein
MALAVVQSPELARLKADWLSSKAKLNRAESEEAREVKLYEAQAGSRRELEAARSEAATARADEEATRLSLEARGLRPEQAGATFTVKSPRAGVVQAWKVQVGQGIEAGQELGTFQGAFAALARVELPLPVPEGWSPGTVTKVRSSDGHQWQGRLESAPMALSQDTRRLSYRLRLKGGALPMAGTPLEVYIPLAQGVSLPQSALQQMEGIWGVFVGEGDFAVFRPVKRGVELGTEVLVLEGVKPGETVVAEGAYLLKALQQKRSEPAEGGGHGH